MARESTASVPEPAATWPSQGFDASADIENLINRGRGMWPAECLAGYSRGLSVNVGDHLEGPSYAPDLSLIRSEWYFSKATSHRIAGMAEGNILLAGAPTIAALIPGSTLVESSPWAHLRLDLDSAKHVRIDFEDYWTQESYDFVAFDPPWYHPALTNWINNAAYFTQRGSRITFPLFGEGTRPSAADERRKILEFCKSIGSPHVERDLVVYDTPRFELEALEAAGIHLRGQWRRSDLVTLTVETPPNSLKSIKEPMLWDEIRIGSQLHSVKRTPVQRPPGNDGQMILPIPGVPNWTLDSVSRRDSRWEFINLWSSDNRVGHTPDPSGFLGMLRDVADGEFAVGNGLGVEEVQLWTGMLL